MKNMNVSLSYAARTWGIYAVLVFLCLLFMTGASGSVILTILNIAVLLGFILVAFNEGAYNGEKACTLAVSLEKQMKEGRVVDEKTRRQVFSKKTGVTMLVICLIPFLLISVLNLAVAPMYPEVETTQVEREKWTDPNEVAETVETRVNPVNIIARLVFMPYVFTYGWVSSATLNLLFLLYGIPMPVAAFVGYMMGPALRQKKLKDIALGKKRKMRNLKVNRQRKSRGPKAEV